MSKVNLLLDKLDQMQAFGVEKVGDLNPIVKQTFTVLPFYKVLNISREKIEEILCFILDNYTLLDEINKVKLDLFLMDFGWASHQRNSMITNNSIESKVFREIHSFKNIVLTNDQYQLNRNLEKFLRERERNNLFISAPTSFGKTTLLINSLSIPIALKKSVFIILPSKNLINEMVLTIKKEFESIDSVSITSSVISFVSKYKLGFTNIFVGTAERFFGINQFIENFLFDVVVVDEAHLVSDYINDRSRYLALTVKRHSKVAKMIYLVPGADICSLQNRLKNLDISFSNPVNFSVESEMVFHQNFLVRNRNGNKVTVKKLDKADYLEKHVLDFEVVEQKDTTLQKLEIFNELLLRFSYLRNKSIIYINNPNEALKIAKIMKSNMQVVDNSNNVVDAYLAYLTKWFPSNYILIDSLKKGIVINIGAMDELSKKFAIECFKSGLGINYLIANSTINEGVNLFAKNIIVFSINATKTHNADIIQRNLLGRVGRFNQFFVGNRFIIDTNKSGDGVVITRLKNSLTQTPIFLPPPDNVVNDSIGETVSTDSDFTDEFIQKNNLKLGGRVKIPLSRYSYPKFVYDKIIDYVVNLKIIDVDKYIKSFFEMENLTDHLVWFQKMLFSNNMSKVFQQELGYRPSGYLISLYLDYLNGVSIKVIIERNIRSVMKSEQGTFYRRNYAQPIILHTTLEDFEFHEKDVKIDIANLSKEDYIDFINSYIQQLLKDINGYCAFGLKKFYMVIISLILEKHQGKGVNVRYEEYWCLLENGSLDKKVGRLVELGIEDKFLQGVIIKDDDLLNEIINSDNIERVIIERFGENSVEHYAYIL